MIFKGTPNLFVKISSKLIVRVTGKKGFYFDKNGRYETDNELLCRLLEQHFEIENNVTDDKPTEEKIFKCKHCDYTTTNKGLLMTHYREHKKGV